MQGHPDIYSSGVLRPKCRWNEIMCRNFNCATLDRYCDDSNVGCENENNCKNGKYGNIYMLY